MTIRDLDMGTTCDGFGEAVKCTGQAYYSVSQHDVGHCDEGNIVRLLCPQCTAAVLQINAFAEPFACTKCSKVFHHLADLVEVEHLIKGASV